MPPQMGPPPMAEPEPSPLPAIDDIDDLKPIYPRWAYDRVTQEVKKEPKPSRAYMDAAVTDDQLRHSALVNRFAEDLRTYRMMDRTIFEDLKRDDLEMFVSASPAIQVHKIANMVSNIEHVVQFAYRTEKESESAQRLENAAYHILEQADLHHRMGGNASLKWEWVFSHLVYGRIVTRVLPDSSDPDFPWDIRSFDPSQCFPTYGGKKGLIRMSLVYNESVDRILQMYGDDPDVNKKVLKKYTDKESDKLDLNHVGEVRECWTPWHRWLEFDGEDILPVTEHGIGRVPFVTTVGPGEMGSATMPGGMSQTRLEISSLMPLAEHPGADVDLTQKGLSFFHHQRPALRQQAAVMSIQMTAAKQRLNPPMEKRTPYEDPGQPVSMATGDTNFTRQGEEIRPLLSQANAVDMGVVLSSLDKELQKGGLPDHLFGATEGSNVSGFAVESMIAAAKDRLQPTITDLEIHSEDVLDLCFYLFRNMGHIFVDDAEGKLRFPAKGRGTEMGGSGQGPARPDYNSMMAMLMQQTQGMPPDIGAWQAMGMDESGIQETEDKYNYINREDILAVGTRPEVKLQSVHLQNMTMLANVASMLIDKKIWSRERAMDEFNIKNPNQEFDRILKEDAMTNPKMLELVMFPEALYNSGNMSGFLAYFASVIAPILMQMQMGGAPPGASPSQPGGPQTIQGDSQPMMGQGPGSPSGPGNAGPPGVM